LNGFQQNSQCSPLKKLFRSHINNTIPIKKYIHSRYIPSVQPSMKYKYKLRFLPTALKEWKKLDDNLRKILDKKIYLISDPLLNPDNLHSTIERLVTEKGVKLVVLDYLQLMMPYRMRRNREQEISTIIRKIKAIAKELNIVVLLLSQLNRSVELRSGDKRPMLSDLRESGAIEDDADKVIFLHRPEFYGIYEDEQGNSLLGIAELIIAKNRTGVTDEFPLRFNSNYGKFTQLDIILEALGDIHPEDILDGGAPF